MATFGLLLLPGAALLMLAAHFIRSQLWLLAVLCVALIALLAVPRRLTALVLQVALIAGGIEWLRTLFGLVSARMAAGAPFTRLTLILGGIALVTCASAMVFRTATLRARYR